MSLIIELVVLNLLFPVAALIKELPESEYKIMCKFFPIVHYLLMKEFMTYLNQWWSKMRKEPLRIDFKLPNNR